MLPLRLRLNDFSQKIMRIQPIYPHTHGNKNRGVSRNSNFWLKLMALHVLHPVESTVCCYKNVECHFFVATVLGLASELKLVVVKIPFKCVF